MMTSIFRREALKHWVAVEFLLFITGITDSSSQADRGPFIEADMVVLTVQWTKTNPTPWNDIKPTQNTKIYDPKGHFPERWSREKL
ncbi:hypothetical protein MPER_11282 [Moniliophthora perniciosa FA553]|nr:hypothetical protein MPER_11282 [Moniliophthora perniciosa FA553]